MGRGRGRRGRYTRSGPNIEGEFEIEIVTLADFPPEGFEIFSLQEDGVTPTAFENAIELDGNVIGCLFPNSPTC